MTDSYHGDPGYKTTDAMPEREPCYHYDIQASDAGVICVECGEHFDLASRALDAESEVEALVPLARLGEWVLQIANDDLTDRESGRAIWTAHIRAKAQSIGVDLTKASALLAARKGGRMKHETTLRRELRRVAAQLKRDLSPSERAEQYGAQQALSWALGQNACAPSRLVVMERPDAARKGEEV